MKNVFCFLSLISIMSLHAQTQIIAHRGFWNTHPKTSENSIKALENAQNIKVYGSEFDIHMTKDGKLIINHDEHHGKMEISETDFCKLKKLKLSNGEKIPTLKKYLKQGKKDPSVKLIIEIKPAKSKDRENEIVTKVLKIVKDLDMENQSDYISFSLNICKEIKKQNPAAKVQYLEGNLSPEQIKSEGLDGIDYHYSVFEKHPDWISEAKKLGLTTNAWTVNDIEIFKKLSDSGIDFITTNTPDVFQQQNQ